MTQERVHEQAYICGFCKGNGWVWHKDHRGKRVYELCGCSKSLGVQICEACNGSGNKTCEVCNGYGCFECNDTGKTSELCETCKGEHVVTEKGLDPNEIAQMAAKAKGVTVAELYDIVKKQYEVSK